jgi:predicted membrane-bound mannosyltransferase
MATNTVTWIVVAAVVVLLLILVAAFVGRSVRDKKRRAEAGRIREEVRVESSRVEKREAIAAETEARARAAQAEAEAKAAEAARLQDRAATHREHVDTSREELEARRERADQLDPRNTDPRNTTDERVGDDGEIVQETQADHEAQARRATEEHRTIR